MLQESLWGHHEAGRSERARHLKEEADFLRHAAFETARGLYEAGGCPGPVPGRACPIIVTRLRGV
jgi:hypothetical protein